MVEQIEVLSTRFRLPSIVPSRWCSRPTLAANRRARPGRGRVPSRRSERSETLALAARTPDRPFQSETASSASRTSSAGRSPSADTQSRGPNLKSCVKSLRGARRSAILLTGLLLGVGFCGLGCGLVGVGFGRRFLDGGLGLTRLTITKRNQLRLQLFLLFRR